MINTFLVNIDFWANHDVVTKKLFFTIILAIISNYITTPRNLAIPKNDFVAQLLNTSSPARIRSFLRINLTMFNCLLA